MAFTGKQAGEHLFRKEGEGGVDVRRHRRQLHNGRAEGLQACCVLLSCPLRSLQPGLDGLLRLLLYMRDGLKANITDRKLYEG